MLAESFKTKFIKPWTDDGKVNHAFLTKNVDFEKLKQLKFVKDMEKLIIGDWAWASLGKSVNAWVTFTTDY